MTYYMITFDRKRNKAYGRFHEDFTNSGVIKGWFHYIKSSYIVASLHSAGEVSRHFTDCATKHGMSTTHLVMEVNISNRQGMLVEDAWKWIHSNSEC